MNDRESEIFERIGIEDIREEAERDAYLQEIGERLADELVISAKQAAAGRHRHDAEADEKKKRNQRIVDDFIKARKAKRQLSPNKPLTFNEFSVKHAADYGRSSKTVRTILHDWLVGS